MKRTALLLAMAAFAATLPAQNISRRTKNSFSGEHSVWRTGNRPANSPAPFLIGFPWDIGTSFGRIKEETIDFGLFTISGSFGLEFAARTTGRTGIEVTTGISGGRAAWDIGYETLWSYPWIATPGSRVSLTVVTRPDSGILQTSTPAFQLSMVGVGRADFNYSTRGAFGTEIWNASGYYGSSTEARKDIVGITDLSGAALGGLNFALGQLGLGADFQQPDVRATGAMGADGTLTARGSSRFASLEGSLVDMLLLLFPPGVSDAVGLLLEGNFRYGGWGADWKLAKSYVNMDLRMTQQVKVEPRPQFRYTITGPNGQLAAGNAALGETRTFEFTMPNGPVTLGSWTVITPRVTSSVGADIAGTFKVIPLYLSAAGSFGPGRSFDIVCDLAQEYGMGSESLGRMASEEFELSAQSAHAPAMTMRPGDPNRVTPEAFWMNPSEIDAVESAPFLGAIGGDDRLVRRVLYPAEGTSWVGANARFFLDFDLTRVGEGWNPTQFPAELRFDLNPRLFTPGVHQAVLSRNVSGQNTHVWRFPLYVEYGQPRFDGQMFTRSDFAPSSLTNRLEADGRDKKIYFEATRIFPGKTRIDVFRDGESADSGISVNYAIIGGTGSDTVEATIPAEVAARFGGSRLRFSIRNPILRVKAGDPQWRTATSDGFLHVVVGVPAINKLLDARTLRPQLGGFDGPSTWFVEGRGFTPNTTFLLRPTTGLLQPVTLRSTYDGFHRVRVEISRDALEFLQRNHRPVLIASTPTFSVPADAQNPIAQFGGISTAFNVDTLRTSGVLEMPEPGAIARGRNVTIDVRGTAFMEQGSTHRTAFTVNGTAVTASFLDWDSVARRHARARLTIPASLISKAEVVTITATNPGATPAATTLRVENAPPRLPSGMRLNRYLDRAKIDFSGCVIYPETEFMVTPNFWDRARGATNPAGTIDYVYEFNEHFGIMNTWREARDVTVRTPGLGGGSATQRLPVYDMRTTAVLPTITSSIFDRRTNSVTFAVELRYTGTNLCDGPFALRLNTVNGTPQGDIIAPDVLGLPLLGLRSANRTRTFFVRVNRTGPTMPTIAPQVIDRP